ncbi:MAG: ArsB/NhaD family transporter [Micavibrio aeruginosavorus]|uniref:ArsB/NhaD family transporter n=1 Tax=Micavibrio aeruginosavorus TaxID=349221 RepID=A0A7T5R2B0_9BACT|nr:MAG: ArsB/NhaD family transporter [Micavibrio aeruginosavorus]
MSITDPLILSCLIMGLVYAFIITEKMNQAVIALVGACLTIYLGIQTQHAAIEAIDFNTIFLLIGMMMIVTIMKRSGVFQFVAIMAARIVRANPRGLLVVLSLITAVFSAFLDNVTTVMLIVPITLLLTEQLKQKPYPFLIAQIFFSNIGGTSTLIGDPPNILIGSAVGLSFMDFLINMGPVIIVIVIALLAVFDFIWGRHMTTSLRARAHLLRYDPYEALEDKPLLYKSLFVLALVISGFILGHSLFGFETGIIALSGACLLLILDSFGLKREERNQRVQKTFEHVEWETIFFFMGLFMVVSALEHTGALQMVADNIIHITKGDFQMTALVILWTSTVFSAFVNNIPFVATLIPVIEGMAPGFGGAEAIEPLWWSLVLGACLGGNGSLVGASANVIVAAYAQRAGQPISFIGFLAHGFPLMMLTILISTIYVWLVYL